MDNRLIVYIVISILGLLAMGANFSETMLSVSITTIIYMIMMCFSGKNS